MNWFLFDNGLRLERVKDFFNKWKTSFFVQWYKLQCLLIVTRWQHYQRENIRYIATRQKKSLI